MKQLQMNTAQAIGILTSEGKGSEATRIAALEYLSSSAETLPHIADFIRNASADEHISVLTSAGEYLLGQVSDESYALAKELLFDPHVRNPAKSGIMQTLETLSDTKRDERAILLMCHAMASDDQHLQDDGLLSCEQMHAAVSAPLLVSLLPHRSEEMTHRIIDHLGEVQLLKSTIAQQALCEFATGERSIGLAFRTHIIELLGSVAVVPEIKEKLEAVRDDIQQPSELRACAREALKKGK